MALLSIISDNLYTEIFYEMENRNQLTTFNTQTSVFAMSEKADLANTTSQLEKHNILIFH